MRYGSLLSVLVILLAAINLWARAGGAGGGGHSGGSHSSAGFGGGLDHVDGNGGLVRLLVWLLFETGPIGWIILIAVVVIWIRVSRSKKNKKSLSELSLEKVIAEKMQPSEVEVSFLDAEELEGFLKKVQISFLTIQKSWSEKRLDLMRRFITDGVYQRFHAQFIMMNLLEQENLITDVQIHSIRVIKTQHDGGYDCVDVAIQASAGDQFVCAKFPGLNSVGGIESFIEYWSFVRRQDYKKGSDIFQSELCPKCSAPLTLKLVETARCPYCNTYLNSGEYDWVLAEITQELDGEQMLARANQKNFTEILQVYPEFSKQMIEDRASNAMMQILVGLATKNVVVLKKFSTTAAFEKIKRQISAENNIYYSRLYTQYVDLTQAQVQGSQIRCYVTVKYSFQRISLGSDPAKVIAQPILDSEAKIIVLMRNISSLPVRGSVYANSCPSCGASQKDSLSAVCAYCSSPLNDANLEWVVEDLINL